MDWLTKLFGGLGNAAKGAAGSIGKGVGSVASGMGNMLQPIASTLMGGMGNGAQGAVKGVSPVTQMFQNQGSTTQQRSVGSSQTAQPGGNPLSGMLNGVLGLFQQKQPVSQAMQGGQGTKLPTSASNAGSYAPSLIGAAVGKRQGAQSPQPNQANVAPKPSGGGIMDFLGSLFKGGTQEQPNVGQTLLGGGMSLLGQGMNTPKIPDLSQLSSVNALRGFDMRKNTTQLPPELLTAMNNEMDRTDKEEIRQFYQRYANLRPSSSPETDSIMKEDLDNLQRKQSDRRVDQLAKLQTQNAITQMGLNQAEVDQLASVALQDVAEIMSQWGLDYDKAMQFKEMFGRAGETLASSGLGIFQPMATPDPTKATA